MATTILNPRDQRCLVGIETTEGTLLAPASCSLAILAGAADLNQTPNFSDSKEIKQSRDVTDRFQGRWNPGTFTLPMYLRPSGTAGTAPDGDELLEALMGVKTVNASTSVVYSQAVAKKSVSIWLKQDKLVRGIRGAVVTGMSLDLQTGAGGAEVSFTGQFAEMVFAGNSTLDGGEPITETDIALVTDGAKRFKVGAFVEFTDGTTTWNNSNAGYEITAINYTTDVITIGTGLEIAMDDTDIIQGFLPAGSEVGSPLEMRKGYIKFGATTQTIKGCSCNVNDPVTYLEEITQDSYPDAYLGTMRDISGTITKLMRQADVADFYYGDNNTTRDLTVVVGDTAGSIVEINMPTAELEFPNVSVQDPTIETAINWKALASSGEDSCTITFK